MPVTTAPLVALNPVPGIQVYVDAPLAVKVAVCCPAQIVALFAVIVGVGNTFKDTVVD